MPKTTIVFIFQIFTNFHYLFENLVEINLLRRYSHILTNGNHLCLGMYLSFRKQLISVTQMRRVKRKTATEHYADAGVLWIFIFYSLPGIYQKYYSKSLDGLIFLKFTIINKFIEELFKFLVIYFGKLLFHNFSIKYGKK